MTTGRSSAGWLSKWTWSATARLRLRVGLLEVERARVDAVAQPVRPWPVREHVTEVAAAPSAHHFDAVHAVRIVVLGLHRVRDGRVREAGPAAAGVELLVGSEQVRAARGTP